MRAATADGGVSSSTNAIDEAVERGCPSGTLFFVGESTARSPRSTYGRTTAWIVNVSSEVMPLSVNVSVKV